MKEIDNAAREYVNPKLALNVNDFGERAQLAYQQFSGYDIMDAFEAGANWQKEQMIEKTCEWLMRNDSYSKPTNILVGDFRKTMEDEK